jgi:dihydrofolate reductase
MTPIVIVAAVAENGVIGRDNKLPWRIRSDLQYFKSLTVGRPVVMGRRTYDSIGKPLPDRTNIVVTRDAAFSAPGVAVARDVEGALTIAREDAASRRADSIAVIGGTEIFRQTMPVADRLALTIVHAKPEGDVLFPPIDPADWKEVERRPQTRGPQDDCGFTFVTYVRRT